MIVTAKNSRLELQWNLPKGISETFPSLKKLERGNYKDAEDKLNGIYSYLSLFEEMSCDKHFWDEPFGGVGFSAALATAFKFQISLNELETSLYKYLNKIYVNVTKGDAEKRVMPPAFFRFYDPSDFTFNRVRCSFFQSLLLTGHTLFYTDCFPFSLKPFNESKLEAYLHRCNDWLMGCGWFMDSYYLYRSKNAMIVRITREECFQSKKIHRREISDPFKITVHKGLFNFNKE